MDRQADRTLAPDLQFVSPVQCGPGWPGESQDIPKIPVLQARWRQRRRQTCLADGFMIARGNRPPPRQETLQTSHLTQAEGGLYVRHLVVEGLIRRVRLVVLAESTDAADERFIASQNHATSPAVNSFVA